MSKTVYEETHPDERLLPALEMVKAVLIDAKCNCSEAFGVLEVAKDWVKEELW